jgi:hypothetical protein
VEKSNEERCGGTGIQPLDLLRAWKWITQKSMSTITIPLSDEDFSFLQSYSRAQGTSLEAFLAHQASCLRERLQKPLPTEIAGASGILSPINNPEAARLEHLEKKHQ